MDEEFEALPRRAKRIHGAMSRLIREREGGGRHACLPDWAVCGVKHMR